jgi:hypothetical protein
MKDPLARATIIAGWIGGTLICMGVTFAACIAWGLPFFIERSGGQGQTPIVMLRTVVPPTYTPYPTFTPYPTYTPNPTPTILQPTKIPTPSTAQSASNPSYGGLSFESLLTIGGILLLVAIAILGVSWYRGY